MHHQVVLAGLNDVPLLVDEPPAERDERDVVALGEPGEPLERALARALPREVVRPERIVFTLATADSAGNEIDPVKAGHDPRWPRATVVTVTFVDMHGATKLTLEQNVSEALAKHTGAHPSWLEMLDRLATLIGGGNARNA